MKGTPLKICTHYFSDKQHRVFFNSNGPHRRPNILDLIHIDVFMMNGKSLDGASYIFTFSNDHSRKVRDFVLNSKDHVLGVLKHLHTSVGREKGRKMKCVKDDNFG